MDEYTGGILQNDPDMPYTKNPGPRRILYGPYVKFVLFPEVCAIFNNKVNLAFQTFLMHIRYSSTKQASRKVPLYRLIEQPKVGFFSVKTVEQHIAASLARAAAKLENGDGKGAVRILCSDDKLAVVNTK